MNRFKKVLSFTFLAAAVVGVGASGLVLFDPAPQPSSLHADYVEDVVESEVLPNYFSVGKDAEGNSQIINDTFFFTGSNSFNVRLNTEKVETSETYEGENKKFKYRYTPENADGTYYYFQITGVTFSIDGVSILSDYNEDFDTGKLILTSSANTDFPSSGDNFPPQSLNFDVRYGTTPSITEDEWQYNSEDSHTVATHATVVLGKFKDENGVEHEPEGKLEIAINYNYCIATNQDVGDATEVRSSVETPPTTTISTLFLNENNYISSSTPKISYSTNLTRTPASSDSSATHQFFYFYNYQTDDVPYIKYDPRYLRLSIAKQQNNATQSASIIYDPEEKKINKDSNGVEHIPEFLYDITKADNELTIYFNDVGRYDIIVDYIHTDDNNKTIYTVDRSVKNQKNQAVFMFGTQAFYTDYSSDSNSTKEFRQITDHKSVMAADISSVESDNKPTNNQADYDEFKDEKGEKVTNPFVPKDAPEGEEQNLFKFMREVYSTTPVSTDQTPVKFSYNLANPNVTVFEKGTNESGAEGWVFKSQDENITKTFSTPGTYFVIIRYNCANYTLDTGASASGQTFYQFFYFQINKPTPEITFQIQNKDESWKELMSGGFTNAQQVKIKYENAEKSFNSEVRFEIEKYDFINPGQSFSRRSFTFNDQGEYFETTEGRYTVYIYYSSHGSTAPPIRKSFTIDRQDIEDVFAYSVQTYGVNQEYRSDSLPLENSTNQSFVMTWQPTKRSGASTYAYFKRYPLVTNNLYSSANNVDAMITAFLNGDTLATDKTLDFTTASNWSSYENAYSFRSSVIPSGYVKTDAGLYIFQIFDAAGNSKVQVLLLDDSKPYFTLYKSGNTSGEAGGYSLISSYHTTATDVRLNWGENKGIFLNGEYLKGDVIKDYNGATEEADTNPVYKQLRAFFAENEKIHAFNTSSIPSGFQGNYYLVPLDQFTAFRGLDGNYVPLTDTSSMEIKSSYKVYYTTGLNGGNEVKNYYFSTSDETNKTYLQVQADGTVQSKSEYAITEAEGEIKEAEVYKRIVNGQGIYYYNAPETTDTLLHRVYSTETATKTDEFDKVNFVDMEGTYVFLIRDASNTLGRTLPKDQNGFSSQAFLNHASAFQYIKVTGDTSLTQIYFEDAQGDTTQQVELSTAPYSNSGVNEDGKSYRYSFYEPTCVQKTLYASFIPTSKTSTGTSQIDKVTLKFYPYQTFSYARLDAHGNPVITYYNSLSTVEPEPMILYDYKDGKGDAESETAISVPINVSSQVTTAGKYVLERTYVSDKEGFITGSFDYDQRTLTSIVDRYGVISEQSPVSYEEVVKTYTHGDSTFEVRQIENIIEVKFADGDNFALIKVKIKGSYEGESEHTFEWPTAYRDNVGYYVCDSITEFSILDQSDQVINPVEDIEPTQSTHRSLESLVGGDIFVNMYEGVEADDDGAQVSVTFPYYDGLLPSGESFYTDNKSNWTEENDDPAIKLTTNKLPVSLYIPKVKYTLYNVDEENQSNAMIYSSEQNPFLSHYDGNLENGGSAITSYELHAEIKVIETKSRETKYYHSNGASESGFLTFVDDNGNPVDQFITAGVYVVTVTQGYNSDGNSANNFRKNYKFSLEVQSSAPEFDITANGTPLNNLGSTYYTNSKEVRVTWDDNNTRYMANIDKSNIILKVGNSSPYTISVANGVVTCDNETIRSGLSFSQAGSQNRLNINFENIRTYTHGSKIDITMQYERHDPRYYDTTTKSILLDIDADATHVNALIDKLPSSNPMPMTRTTLRKYYDATGNVISSNDAYSHNFVAAYNVSQDATSQLYRYSYLVDQNFFVNLRDYVRRNAEITDPTNYSNVGWGSVEAYYRVVNDPYNKASSSSGTDEETSYSNFVPSSFTNFNDQIPDENGNNQYFEIVERDKAGNMTIYLVYLYTEDEGVGYKQQLPEGEGPTIYQGIEISDQGTLKQASDAQILTNRLRLYATKNTSITRFNFMGDAWTRFSINNVQYLASPLLADGRVFSLESNNPVEVNLSALLANWATNDTLNLTVLNKTTGAWQTFGITLLNGVNLQTTLSNSIYSEYISIGFTNDVFPVSVTVYEQTSDNPNISPSAVLKNDPNSLENLRNEAYSYAGGWQSTDFINVSINNVLGRVIFTFVHAPANASKIKYEIVDNFGNVYKPAHIFGSEQPSGITSTGNIYTTSVNDASTGNRIETYYVSTKDLRYGFNQSINRVVVEKWTSSGWNAAAQNIDYTRMDNNGNVVYIFNPADETINVRYRLTIKDADKDDDALDAVSDVVYFQIYRMMPHLLGADEESSADQYLSVLTLRDRFGTNVTTDILENKNAGSVTINGTVYNITLAGITFADKITVAYTDSSSSELFDYPYTVYVYREDGSYGSEFVNISSGESFSQSGIYYFLIRYDTLLTFEDRVYRIEILDSNNEFYRVTNNGEVVQRAGSYYKDENGIDNPEYYIVNVRYPDESGTVVIVPNEYQNVDYWQDAEIPEENSYEIVTIRYIVSNVGKDGQGTVDPGIQKFFKYVYITFIPPTSEPVASMYLTYSFSDQTQINRISSITMVPEDEGTDSVKIVYSKFRGIENNTIEISVLKDGQPYTPERKELKTTEGQFSYVEFSVSGTYTISFRDISGNRHLFASGTSQQSYEFTLVFLKDVSFYMTFEDAEGNLQTTDPVQKGVFNNSVTLTVVKSFNSRTYYTQSSIGQIENFIHVKKNGTDYTNYTYESSDSTTSFLFAEPGYYTVSFSAISIATNLPLKEIEYNFTIVNSNESRYSFEFSPYQNYFVESIVKDNLGDITRDANGNLIDELKQLFQTTTVDGKEYLKNFVTSIVSPEMLGTGRYTVTISTGKNLDRDDYSKVTSFSFSYWINSTQVPIDVSASEGEATTKNIRVSFNSERVFEAVGECTIYIGTKTYHISSETIAELGTVNETISLAGTHYITVMSMSGSVLYRYKIVKNEPLNGWAIAAIVIAGIVLIAVIVIIVKLRKRIKVK